MDSTVTNRKRIGINVEVDVQLLKTVDRFLEAHPDIDRSAIVNEALWLWYAREQDRAIEEQHLAPQSAVEQEERAAWKTIQRAAAERIFGSREQ